MIYHVTYANAGGINTYISNLKSGGPDEHQIIEVEQGQESIAIEPLLLHDFSNPILVLHDPAFCRNISERTSTTICMVLHGENQYYYSAAEEFGQLVDGIVCVSESIRRNIPQRFQAKTITIGPSILLTKGHRAQSRKPHEVNLIFVAREDLNKGVQHLPTIDRILIENDIQPEWTIVLGSRPEEVCSFRAWVSENPDRVNVLENIENQKVPKLINEHDALILPSRTEGHPMVLIEALSQGVPPFSFYYSSQCEKHLPVDHENIVGPSRNLEELANRLVLHHQRTQESNEKWKSSATDFVHRYHNPSIQAQKLSDFLDSLPRKLKTPLRQKFYKWKRRVFILLKSW